jgi:uncharacterized membrane protein YvbJ
MLVQKGTENGRRIKNKQCGAKDKKRQVFRKRQKVIRITRYRTKIRRSGRILKAIVVVVVVVVVVALWWW